jgi:peptidoglycan/LPS O-acetylase OafA/YrhL
LSTVTGITHRNETAAGSRGGLLDLLRFTASLLIVIYHFSAEGPRPLESFHPVFLRGYLATDFFLILSGYVLGRSYGPKLADGRLDAGGFMLRRVGRVWPGHLVVLAAFVALLLVAAVFGVAPHHPERFNLGALPMQALLVQAWGVPGGGGWNLPTWSLSALLVCYAGFPLFWRGLGRVGQGAGLVVLGLTGVVIAGQISIFLFGRPLYDLPFQVGAARALPLFFLGACLARTVELAWPGERLAMATGVLASAAFIGLQALGRFDLSSVVCIALIILAAGRLPVRRPRPLLEQGARLSFALFLTHAFTGMLWFTAVRALEARVSLGEPVRWALWGLAFPAALVVAWGFERYVDQPIQAWLTPRLLAIRLRRPELA